MQAIRQQKQQNSQTTAKQATNKQTNTNKQKTRTVLLWCEVTFKQTNQRKLYLRTFYVGHVL